eukprot:gene6601-1178_t
MGTHLCAYPISHCPYHRIEIVPMFQHMVSEIASSCPEKSPCGTAYQNFIALLQRSDDENDSLLKKLCQWSTGTDLVSNNALATCAALMLPACRASGSPVDEVAASAVQCWTVATNPSWNSPITPLITYLATIGVLLTAPANASAPVQKDTAKRLAGCLGSSVSALRNAAFQLLPMHTRNNSVSELRRQGLVKAMLKHICALDLHPGHASSLSLNDLHQTLATVTVVVHLTKWLSDDRAGIQELFDQPSPELAVQSKLELVFQVFRLSASISSILDMANAITEKKAANWKKQLEEEQRVAAEKDRLLEEQSQREAQSRQLEAEKKRMKQEDEHRIVQEIKAKKEEEKRRQREQEKKKKDAERKVEEQHREQEKKRVAEEAARQKDANVKLQARQQELQAEEGIVRQLEPLGWLFMHLSMSMLFSQDWPYRQVSSDKVVGRVGMASLVIEQQAQNKRDSELSSESSSESDDSNDLFWTTEIHAAAPVLTGIHMMLSTGSTGSTSSIPSTPTTSGSSTAATRTTATCTTGTTGTTGSSSSRSSSISHAMAFSTDPCARSYRLVDPPPPPLYQYAEKNDGIVADPVASAPLHQLLSPLLDFFDYTDNEWIRWADIRDTLPKTAWQYCTVAVDYGLVEYQGDHNRRVRLTGIGSLLHHPYHEPSMCLIRHLAEADAQADDPEAEPTDLDSGPECGASPSDDMSLEQ